MELAVKENKVMRNQALIFLLFRLKLHNPNTVLSLETSVNLLRMLEWSNILVLVDLFEFENAQNN